MFNQFLTFTTTSWFIASLLALPLVFFIWWRREKAWSLRIDTIWLALFVVLFLVSFAFRQQPLGYSELIAFTVGPVIYLTATRFNLSKWVFAQRQKLAWGISIIGAVISLYGIVDFIFNNAPRLSGPFQGIEHYTTYPNALAFFLLIVLPINIYILFTSSHRIGNRITRILLLLNASAFLLTFSRGAYLAMATALGLLGVLMLIRKVTKRAQPKLPRMRVFMAVYMIIVAVIFSVLVNGLHRSNQSPELAAEVPLTIDVTERLSDKSISADQSTDERIQFWKGSLKLVTEYPWFGVGSDGFRIQYPRVQSEMLAISNHPHNLFLKIAVENGVPAAAALLIFLAIIGLTSLTQLIKSKTTDKHFWWQATLLMSLTAAIAHLLVDYNINAMVLWLLFWLIVSSISLKQKTWVKHKALTLSLNIVITLLLIAVYAMSLLHVSQYRLVKNGQISDAGYSPFQPLRYTMLDEAVLKGTLPQSQFPEQAIQLRHALAKYPNWAELHVSTARIFAAAGEYPEAIEQYVKALKLNSANHMDWHYEYLKALNESGQGNIVVQQGPIYYQAISVYLEKLRHNAHHTVATNNPQAVSDIINMYINLTPEGGNDHWVTLDIAFQAVWENEKRKFNMLLTGQ